MRILVTYFEPFGGDPENASLEAVTRMARAFADPDIEVVTGELPVVFATASGVLDDLVRQHRPDAVLSVGEAGGRTAITPERRGVNRNNARIPDNAGGQPIDEPIVEGGPDAEPSGFDVDALVAAIEAAGVPATASDDAGLYLCNNIAFHDARLAVPGGFIHVPAVRSTGLAGVGRETDTRATAQAQTLTFDDLARGIEAAVREIARQVKA